MAQEQPDEPVFFLSPAAVTAGARRFLDGFPGLVTYAVKSNPSPAVLMGMISAGLRGFDVASPEEIRLIRSLCPEAALHYHNPIKSRDELRFAHAAGVRTLISDAGAEEWPRLTKTETARRLAARIAAHLTGPDHEDRGAA